MIQITEDHKPSEVKEKNRILAAGGKVYQSNNVNNIKGTNIVGPMRVLPGRLSVSELPTKFDKAVYI